MDGEAFGDYFSVFFFWLASGCFLFVSFWGLFVGCWWFSFCVFEGASVYVSLLFLALALLYMFVFFFLCPPFSPSDSLTEQNVVFSHLFMHSFANSFVHSAIFIKHLLCAFLYENCQCILRILACLQSNGELEVLKRVVLWILSSMVASFCYWNKKGRSSKGDEIIKEKIQLYLVYIFKMVNFLFKVWSFYLWILELGSPFCIFFFFPPSFFKAKHHCGSINHPFYAWWPKSIYFFLTIP